jgi:hypothetical protein
MIFVASDKAVVFSGVLACSGKRRRLAIERKEMSSVTYRNVPIKMRFVLPSAKNLVL